MKIIFLSWIEVVNVIVLERWMMKFVKIPDGKQIIFKFQFDLVLRFRYKNIQGFLVIEIDWFFHCGGSGKYSSHFFKLNFMFLSRQ